MGCGDDGDDGEHDEHHHNFTLLLPDCCLVNTPPKNFSIPLKSFSVVTFETSSSTVSTSFHQTLFSMVETHIDPASQ